MPKAVLSRFLVERIHKDWIDRLYPQGWMVERGRGRVGAGLRNNAIYILLRVNSRCNFENRSLTNRVLTI